MRHAFMSTRTIPVTHAKDMTLVDLIDLIDLGEGGLR
ncbi:hypothetical protein FHS22_005383 [Planomonospora venezuelensis]|uniref:Uncharacterized protein n=1 Tax=Planomonospora venezuelensis TaxID=1999 RepID=A0A841D619_PLAVE|nr:hypothetical protein [Planomonospora venezuelensis]